MPERGYSRSQDTDDAEELLRKLNRVKSARAAQENADTAKDAGAAANTPRRQASSYTQNKRSAPKVTVLPNGLMCYHLPVYFDQIAAAIVTEIVFFQALAGVLWGDKE